MFGLVIGQFDQATWREGWEIDASLQWLSVCEYTLQPLDPSTSRIPRTVYRCHITQGCIRSSTRHHTIKGHLATLVYSLPGLVVLLVR